MYQLGLGATKLFESVVVFGTSHCLLIEKTSFLEEG